MVLFETTEECERPSTRKVSRDAWSTDLEGVGLGSKNEDHCSKKRVQCSQDLVLDEDSNNHRRRPRENQEVVGVLVKGPKLYRSQPRHRISPNTDYDYSSKTSFLSM